MTLSWADGALYKAHREIEPVSKLKLSLVVASSFLAAAAGLLLASRLTILDQSLFVQIMHAFGGHFKVEHNLGVLEVGANIAIALLFASASTLTGYKLEKKISLIVLLQIIVLGLLCQWILWNYYSIENFSLAMLLAIILGFAGGKVLKQTSKRKQTSEAKHYALLIRDLELQQARLQMIKQDEVERRLLAADLHDQVLNDLKIIKQKFFEYQTVATNEVATKIENLLLQAIEEIHEVMDDLCPSILEHLGLAAAIDECLRRAAHTAKLKTRLNNYVVADDLFLLSMTKQALIYRLIQESINNACKHSGANVVQVNLSREGVDLVIKIIDDGKGIDLSMRENTRGIRYMKQRANLIGAKLIWRANDNHKGTLVEIRVNLSGKENAKYTNS